jgi:hypothetical protein
MPCLSGQYNPAIGLLINVGVLPPGTVTPTGIGNAQLTAFPALMDTGASNTCISPAVIQTLKLAPIGKLPMISATHTIPANQYLVDIALLFGPGALFVPNIQVGEFTAVPQSPFQILVGRDIICRGSLALSFDGHFTFSL